MSGETAECHRTAIRGKAGTPRPMTTSEWGLLAALSMLWGGSFFLTRIALEDLPALTIVLLRLGLGAAGLVVVLRCMGLRLPRDGLSWSGYAVMGLLNNALPFCLITWAQIHLTSSVVAVLNATAPFATLVLAHCCTRSEKLNLSRLSGVIAGLSGVAVMMSPGWASDGGMHVAAHVACLLAAISYACAGVFGLGLRRQSAAPITTAAGQLLAATVLLFPVAMVVDKPFNLPPPGLATIAAVFGLAVLSTALAYVLYFQILMTAGATNLLLVTFLIPVSATFLGEVFLTEEVGSRELVGFVFVGAGLIAIDGRAFRFVGWLR